METTNTEPGASRTTGTPGTIDGFIDAWLMDGQGGGRRVTWAQAQALHPAGDEWLWIHLDHSSDDVHQWMNDASGLSCITGEALLQTETRPRCVPMDDGLMVFLRGVNLNPGADPDDMVSIRLWVGARRVISLRKRRLLSVDDLRQSLQRNEGPRTPGGFLVMLVELLLDRVAQIIDDLYDQVDELEDAVLVKTDYRQREQLAAIRRQAIAIRRFMAPQREALNRLALERSSLIGNEHQLYLRESFDRLTRLVEDLDAARERATVTHESLVSRLAEQTNQRMYVLSIVAAIFLPLSFVTGLLGVNVGGIPGADDPNGFAEVVLLMLVIAGSLWAFFRWRRWF